MNSPVVDFSERRGMDKQKALESALAQIERSFGKGSIMKLGSTPALDIAAISTGSIGLDVALGIGGLPKGRVIEIYGPESSGKTTLALHVIAEEQRSGGVCAFVDAEHALDPVYAKKLGVDIDELLISQPDTGEQALEITETLVRSGAVAVVVVDSVAALTPKAELEGEMGDAQVGAQARLMSQAMRKLTAAISRSNCMVIFINQIRMKIGVMFGSPETTSGGNALKFYAIRAPRHPPHRRDQGPRRGRRQHHPRQGRQEQGGAAVQAGRVRHHVRRGHLQARRADRPRGQGRRRREVRRLVLLRTTSASARAARTPSCSSRTTPTSPSRSRTRSAPPTASTSPCPARRPPRSSTTDPRRRPRPRRSSARGAGRPCAAAGRCAAPDARGLDRPLPPATRRAPPAPASPSGARSCRRRRSLQGIILAETLSSRRGAPPTGGENPGSAGEARLRRREAAKAADRQAPAEGCPSRGSSRSAPPRATPPGSRDGGPASMPGKGHRRSIRLHTPSTPGKSRRISPLASRAGARAPMTPAMDSGARCG